MDYNDWCLIMRGSRNFSWWGWGGGWGIQLQTRGGPTDFTIAKTRVFFLENRGGKRSLRDTHSPGWSSFLKKNPRLDTETFISHRERKLILNRYLLLNYK